MEQVYQADGEGCWIACVSMLTGVSYQDIKSRYKFRDEVTGRSAGPVVSLLDELGFDCDARSTKLSKIGALKSLEADALVYTKNLSKKGKEKGGHWMVWDGTEQVLRDPEGWSSDRRRIIKNYRTVAKRSGAE